MLALEEARKLIVRRRNEAAAPGRSSWVRRIRANR
jgi:hypothetical protein